MDIALTESLRTYSFVRVLQTAESNKERFELAEALSMAIIQLYNDDMAGLGPALAWCREQGENVLKTLKKLESEDVTPLVNIAKAGGVGLVEDM